jgi:hypothetical protein
VPTVVHIGKVRSSQDKRVAAAAGDGAAVVAENHSFLATRRVPLKNKYYPVHFSLNGGHYRLSPRSH